MVIKPEQMEIQTVSAMRGGAGNIFITHLQNKADMKHCRLLSKISIPANASIGEHRHQAETEYYIILQGTGTVSDNGRDVPVKAGDLVVTGNGESHSIANRGDTPLEMIAVILTEAE